MKDRVQFQKEVEAYTECLDISNVLKECYERYSRIKTDTHKLHSDYYAIVSHIKSQPDWEYFIDNFMDDERHVPISKFNMVRIHPNRIELRYEPICCQHDNNNIIYGICSFDDILNIEKIIEDRKAYYKENNIENK